METSKVKWFDSRKGYGFLEGTENSKFADIFIHYSETETGDVREGDQVSFKLLESKKGMQATDVKIIKAS